MHGTLAALATWNLMFKGVVGGLITALVAMGIVLVYRSSRVINFAVANMGVPAVALFAVMAGKHGWPYWPSVVAALVVGTLTGAVFELAVIRRLFHAPRVIILVATIGIAQLCIAVTLALPEYRTGKLQTKFPLPFSFSKPLEPRLRIPLLGLRDPFVIDFQVTEAQVLVLFVVPLITLGLWWLLGHTAFGEAVRAAATNADLARLTGISPKMVSTAVVGDRRFARDDARCSSPRRIKARPTSCRSAPTRCCAGWPRRSSAAWSRSRVPRWAPCSSASSTASCSSTTPPTPGSCSSCC